MTLLINGQPAQGSGLPAFRGATSNRRYPLGSISRAVLFNVVLSPSEQNPGELVPLNDGEGLRLFGIEREVSQ